MSKEIIWITTHLPDMERLNRFFDGNDLGISACYSPLDKIYETIYGLMENDGLKVVIVQGELGIEIKKTMSIPVVNVDQNNINLDDQTMIRAAAEAQYQLRLLKEQDRRFESVNSVFNCIPEGIIAVNPNWEIISLNPFAAKILEAQPPQCIGDPLKNYLEIESIRAKLQEGKKVENHIISISDKRLVVSAVPNAVQDQEMGVVLTLQPLDVLHSIEKKLQNTSAEKGFLAKKSLDDIVGRNSGLLALKKKAMRYAMTDSNILITGESGVGKELFAQGIHNQSNRKNAPFVAINCASLPENLLERELFGYVKEVLPGMKSEGKAGLLELANTGTIFLDEIGETSLNVQLRLLRVIQERSVIRIGGSTIIPLNVRVIAATNRNLKEYIREGRFRQELYYRLCVLPIHVMPLRERREDILEIIYHVLRSKNKDKIRFSEQAEKVLMEYDWPGNVRELMNFVERIMVLHDQESDYIMKREVKEALLVYGEEEEDWVSDSEEEKEHFEERYERYTERERILEALQSNGWSRRRTANDLGISTTTLWRKMRKWGILVDMQEL